MPNALPENILSSLIQIPHEASLNQAFIQPEDLAPGERPPWATGGEASSAIAFQYWPETISDSRGSEWNPKPVPGGSHPIYQWSTGSERRISFTAIFTTDTEPDNNLLNLTTSEVDNRNPYSPQQEVPLSGVELGTRDLDLRAVVSWLRWYTYPSYGLQDIRVYEPAKCILVMPNMGLNYDGSDYLLTVMTQCDVTYEACFPNGFPRIIEVSLEFAEVVQSAQRIRFQDRKNMRPSGTMGAFLGVNEGTNNY